MYQKVFIKSIVNLLLKINKRFKASNQIMQIQQLLLIIQSSMSVQKQKALK